MAQHDARSQHIVPFFEPLEVSDEGAVYTGCGLEFVAPDHGGRVHTPDNRLRTIKDTE